MVTKIISWEYILITFILTWLPLNYINPHDEFYKIYNGRLEEFEFDAEDPDNDWDDIVVWQSTQASSIPIYYKSWSISYPYSLDPSSSKTQVQDAYQIWHDGSGAFGFYETFSETDGVDLWFSNVTGHFPDPYANGGVTFMAVEYYGWEGYNHVYKVSTYYPVNQGIYDSQILFNNTASFTSQFVWVNYTEDLEWNWICFKQVALHELGHLIGLAHCTYSTAVMYNQTQAGSDFYTLTQADLNGLYILAYATPVCEDCPPDAPDNFSATIVGQNVILTWDLVDQSYVTGLKLYRNGQYTSLSKDKTSYTYNGDVNSFPIEYKIGAWNLNGESVSPPINASVASSSISSYTFWTGLIYVNSNVTVSSIADLVIGADTKIIFNTGHNYNLTINGHLSASGTSLGPIIFSSNSTNPTVSNWGNITLSGSGASGSIIKYANIQYATRVEAINTSNILIQNCNITNTYDGIRFYGSTGSVLSNYISTNSAGHGIIIEEGSTVTCDQNDVNKTSATKSGVGILFRGGSGGTMWQNDVNGWDWGVGAIYSSSPHFCRNPLTSQNRNNRITNCRIGVDAYQSSWPVLGAPQNGYGNNSIYTNSYKNVYFTSGGTLWALANYWLGQPTSSMFYLGSGCTIMTDNWLSNNPWAGIPKMVAGSDETPNSGEGETDQPTVIISNLSGENDDSFFRGVELRNQEKYKEAMDFFISYIAKHPADQAAYIELYNCYNKETANDLISFFSSIHKEAAKEHKFLLSYLYLKVGDVEMAKKVNNGIIVDNPNTELSSRAKINKIYMALYNDNDLDGAFSIFDEVLNRSDLSNSLELSLVQQAIESYAAMQGIELPPGFTLPKVLAKMEIPDKYALLGNFPNPFNPTTTISYSVPYQSFVELVVYDIMGRVVKTLNIAAQPVGRQSITWDGTNENGNPVSSGIYLYKISAKSLENNEQFVKTAKLMLLK
jgi:tetratricopeptide (TPR) repeat protein